jgi:ATP-dependent helicase/nuclease subunit B
LDQVRIFLEQKRQENQLFVNEDGFWSIQLNKFLILSEKFYEFEKQRMQFFNTRTEVSFEMHFDPVLKAIVPTSTDHSIAIRGRIDRLDQHINLKYYLIYDYKSSSGQATSYPNWISENQFQLLFYIFAVEIALFENADVKGALYYLYKNFDLSKGLVEKEVAQQELNLSGRLKSIIDDDKKLVLKEKFIQFISETLTRLQKGQFKALPRDEKICFECDWRKLCRAQHLM